MKLKKAWQVAVFIVLCILLNYTGRAIGQSMNLPLWLDSYGTALTAYTLGPACGAAVGMTGNLIYGILSSDWHIFLYGLTSILIGIITGITARRGWFEHSFGAMSASVAVTLASIVTAVPFNQIFSGGSTGNLWGDSVMRYLEERHVPQFPAMVA